MFKRTLLLAGISALPLAAIPATGWSAPSQTAQSIMANITGLGSGEFLINQTQVYSYNATTAASYFINTLASGPSVSCSGSPTNCATANQPGAPATPLPDPDKVSHQGSGIIYGSNECSFAAGGPLTRGSYTQSVTVNGANGHGNWTFTWTYSIDPTQSTVAALTAWDLVQDNGSGGLAISLNAQIAGQSVVVSSQQPTGKYSFSLDDVSTTPPTSRVTSLSLTINDGTSDVLTANPNAINFNNLPGSTPYGGLPAADFTYTANGGSFGAAQNALIDTANSQPAIATGPGSNGVPGDARSILNGSVARLGGAYHDVFRGNDNGGSTQVNSSLAYATFDNPVAADLGSGSYTVTLTGTIKGNGTSVTQAFSVAKTLHIITPGCNGQGQLNTSN